MLDQSNSKSTILIMIPSSLASTGSPSKNTWFHCQTDSSALLVTRAFDDGPYPLQPVLVEHYAIPISTGRATKHARALDLFTLVQSHELSWLLRALQNAMDQIFQAVR